MGLQKIKIRLYSEIKDISSITAAITRLEALNNFEFIISKTRDFIIDSNEIAIIQINNLNSNFLSKIIDAKSSLGNIIFIVPDDKGLLISTLVKLGFTDIFVFPYEIVQFTSYLTDLLEKYKNKLQREFLGGNGFKDYFTATGASIHDPVYTLVKKVAKNPSINVLITGDTGTGKGLLAKTIHEMTSEEPAPFVDILCTSIPEALLESELFGHEKGAFTNAQSRKIGLFEMAENGTLFLDEIADLSLPLQAKLLRVLEKKVIRRLGGVYDIPVKARIISATNKNLEKLMEQDLFRSDLYYRLNTVTIELEPLRHRGKEIVMLSKYFVNLYNMQFDKKIKRMDKNVEKFITSYPWPGNIRELKNSIERAVLLGEGPSIKLKHFHKAKDIVSINSALLEDKEESITISLNVSSASMKELNKIYVEKMLEKLKGNKAEVCKILGIPRSTLYRILR